MKQIARVPILLVWLLFGLALILVPWSDIWETNYFMYQYPGLGLVAENTFLRGVVSGLGFMNVLLSLEAFRRKTSSTANRN
ncbi:MAG TPA: hypothetical protein VN788_13510 [Verrucomicrobiae bacterium]|nr:hypothetical protein [Verrucomicrobiae bacterium]